jgi:hypothetical protein
VTWGRNVTEAREKREQDKARNMASLLLPPRGIHRGVYSVTPHATAAPKHPSSRNANLRRLAEGEACCGCDGRYCDPSTTVWAHTNGLADGKGRGYKAHDHLGAFLGMQCHDMVDGRAKCDDPALLMAHAQERTANRLREIAASPTLKPWKVEAARWALDQLEAI